jgi:hypothetical protein
MHGSAPQCLGTSGELFAVGLVPYPRSQYRWSLKFEESEATQLHNYFLQGIHLDDAVKDAFLSATATTRGDACVGVRLTQTTFYTLRIVNKIDFPDEFPAAGLLTFQGVTVLNGKLIPSLKRNAQQSLTFWQPCICEGNHFVGRLS